jgi:hypothetical protein
VTARGLQEVEGAVGVDREVGGRIGRRPVVRRLRGGVDDDLQRPRVLAKDGVDRLGVADVDGPRVELRIALGQGIGHREGRGGRPEELRPHVVVDPHDVVSSFDEVSDRL